MQPFFTLAAVSPTRQRAFHALLLAHLATLGVVLAGMDFSGAWSKPLALGNVLLIAGIIEGALLIGWRLSQLPKSQALEFLLVSPIRPGRLFRAEALVGLARLALVTLSGLPILLLLIYQGCLYPEDVAVLLAVPFVWGAVTGLGLVTWAYETDRVRRVGERVVVGFILLYLVVGVLAAEHLPEWLAQLPPWLGRNLLAAFHSFHNDNPFGAMRLAMEQTPAWGRDRVIFVCLLGAGLAAVLLWRGSSRLQGHFHDLHYRPVLAANERGRPPVGDAPLSWWAVKRVTRYSGRINLWLAGGFGLLYATYTVLEADWPPWLGRQVFVMFEQLGGIAMLAAALVLLAAVPAAFQYGLWDASAQDRCQRLELLLLTHLDGTAYWHAAAAAAWRRGRGYFAVAALLWLAAWLAGKATLTQVAAALAAGVVLWGLYFALGFRAFSKGRQANTLGLALTLLLPLATWLVMRAGWPDVATLLPPGSVYAATTNGPSLLWALGPLSYGLFALALAQWSQRRCEEQLRGWYSAHHGAK
jgi:hypothetical protein